MFGKIIIHILVIGILFNNMGIRVQAETPEPEKTGTELLVLIDNSESIRIGNQEEIEIEWAEKLSAYSRGTEIKLNFLWFDDSNSSEYDYKERLISSNNISECVSELEGLSHKGEFTDLRDAITSAQKYMEEDSRAANQYILILSDAKLELRENSKEEAAKKDFKERVKKFAMSSDLMSERGVILVELGEKNLFDEICKEVKESEKHNILYLDGNIGSSLTLDDLIRDIFAFIAVPIEQGEINEIENGSGNAEFLVKEKCSRAIVNVRNVDKKVPLRDTHVGVKYGDKSIVIDDENKCELEYSLFIYLQNPEIGDYSITLPKGNYEYDIVYQKSYVLDKVELIIFKPNGTEESVERTLENGIKKYCAEDNEIQLGMKLNTKGTINRQDYEVMYLMEKIDKEDDIDFLIQSTYEVGAEYRKCLKVEENLSMIKMNTIDNLENGEYILRLRVSSGGKDFFSNPVIIEVNKEKTIPASSDVLIELEVNQEAVLSEIVDEFESDSNQKYCIVFSEREDKNGNQDSEYEKVQMDLMAGYEDNTFFGFENGRIKFKKGGIYRAEISNGNGEVLKNITFDILEEMTLFEKIWEWFNDVVKLRN